jgi:AcrR family transcriptional regulator
MSEADANHLRATPLQPIPAPSRRGQRTRQLIIERTSEVFDQWGFAAATLSQLVASTGLTRGAFYFHFESKEALAAEIIEAQARRWPPLLVEVRRAEPDPLNGLLLFAFRASNAVQSDSIMRAANRLMRERSLIRRQLPETFSWWLDTVEQFLTEAAEQGDLMELSRLVPPERRCGESDCAAAGRRHVAKGLVAGWLGDQLVAGPDCDSLADLLFTSWSLILPELAARQHRRDQLVALVERLTREMRSAAAPA